MNNIGSAYRNLEQYDSALKLLQSIDFEADLFPLERYLIFELYKVLLFPDQKQVLLSVYPLMFNEQRVSLSSVPNDKAHDFSVV